MYRLLKYSTALKRIWLNWVLAPGTVCVLLIASRFVSPSVLPIVAFILQGLLFMLIRINREAQMPICAVIPFLTSRIMFWSAVTMVVINLMYSHWFVSLGLIDLDLDTKIPYIPQLIISTVSVIISLWGMAKGPKLAFCRDCTMRYGTDAERGMLGRIFSQEAVFQGKVLAGISVGCCLSAWIYYAFFYINVNINSVDHFFFIWLPIIVFIISVIYMGIRLFSLWGYYYHNLESGVRSSGPITMIRYILIHGDYICLRLPDHSADEVMGGAKKYDIPAKVTVPFHEHVSQADAMIYYEGLTKLRGGDVRYMYSTTSTSADFNIFHYLCFLNDEEREQFDKANPHCKWFTIREITNLINHNKTERLFSAEMVRLHTVAMAWKTYDRDGNRRYKIKNYTPGFRVSDIHKWDVDYDDIKWLLVANNNEDVPFYRLRRFWRKYINGIGD